MQRFEYTTLHELVHVVLTSEFMVLLQDNLASGSWKWEHIRCFDTYENRRFAWRGVLV